MRLRLRSVCANSPAMPTNSREKLTCPVNSTLDHRRVVRPWGEEEAGLDCIRGAGLQGGVCHAGNTLKAINPRTRRTAPKAKSSHPLCRSTAISPSLVEAQCNKSALEA